MLHSDLLALQHTGIDRLTDKSKTELRTRYTDCSNPAANEVVDWLDGGYAITDEMLQTQ
jgi:hyaluronoglucosaminidase